ncbi:ABC transporter permease [Deinococcus seoulensis]|uniref:ABC transporter permease n=1 Tax=Deinococcus seoulensis TaxID=1837379 RepID=A0ABQ2RQH6_9DEIO|nr:sugar ABC transporter permease [Deinococcus seoulensis]GGR50181.1 ABC transporter permease [Deinococcus seoulensis]
MTVNTAPKPAKTRGIETARARQAFWLLLPTLIAIALVAGYPLYRTIYFSMFEANLTAPDQKTFIGLGNFWFTTEDGIALGFLQDPQWWGAVKNTLLFTVISVFLETVFGMIIALVVNSAFKGRGFLRTAMLVPWAIPTVVSAQMWAYLYNDSFGLVGRGVLGGVALLASSNEFLGVEQRIWAMIAVDVWKTTSFMALLILAGLQSLPSDMYEAADMDGASKWTQFWRLTLPLLRPALLVALVFRSLDALRVFDIMSVMLGNVSAARTSMTGYARQALIDNQLLGMGSAVSVAVFVIIMVIVVIYVTAFRVKFD